MVADLWTPTIEVPRGHVTVELFDERGRCKQKEEGENFVSAYVTQCMKQMQRFAWGQYFPGTKNDDAYGRGIWDFPPMPFNHIACWNDASAEDAANEKNVIGGPIVAFASRFPQGSPDGARGIINFSEAVATGQTSLSWVWDWLTSNGNGTFQSVGWMNCYRAAASNVYPYGVYPDPFYGAVPLTVSIATATTFYRGGLWHDGTNWLTLHTTGQTAGSSGYAIYSVDPTTGIGTLVATLAGTDFRYQTSTGATPVNAFDLCKIGTDFYVIGTNSGGICQVVKYNSSGTVQWTVAHNAGASEMPVPSGGAGACITTDGTDLFVGYSNSTIYKLSASTGLVTATITVSALPTGSVITGISHDGTNLRIITSLGILCSVNPSTGALVTTDPIVVLDDGVGDGGTATAPFSGSWTGPSGAMNQSALMVFNTTTTSSSAMDDMAQSANMGLTNVNAPGDSSGSFPYGGGLHFRSGKVWWMTGNTSSSANPTRVMECTYTALGSRVKLASPVVKDSSKTMKITYTLTFA